MTYLFIMYTDDHLHGLRPMEIEMLRTEIRQVTHDRQKADAAGGLFAVKTGDQWLTDQHQAVRAGRLFGEFWYERELCILFADTNMGKSILAVQLADSLANGRRIEPFAIDTAPMNVLYMDFELSAQQFERRYTNETDRTTHNFGPRLFRAEYNLAATTSLSAVRNEKLLYNGIENAILSTGAKALIIDNITFLRNGTERAKDALPLMKELTRLKQQYRLSILVLAHTPKRRPGQPLTANDLQGSKMLINFADSACAIGQSSMIPQLRYLKQIKQRSTQELYGQSNICLCRIERDGSMLRFDVTGFAAEQEHLKTNTNLERQLLFYRSQGYSQRQMATEANISVATVNRLLKRAGAG